MDLLKSVLSSLDIATSILILILMLGAWILWKVQQDPDNDFNFEEMLRDDSGKPSAFRLAVFVSLAVSTWVMMYIVLNTNSLDTWIFVTYLGIWSGAKVAETAIVAYQASKGISTNRSEDGYDRHDRHDRSEFEHQRDINNQTEGRSRRKIYPPPNIP